MERKDYYLILGVSRRENLRGIQEAFRELAKKYHPDRAGPENTGKFQEIQEAYGVLSDPEKRELYNHQIEEREAGSYSRREPIYARSPSRPEPLIPKPMPVLHGFETIRPSFESLFDRFLRNFTGEKIPKGERLEDLNVEVILSPEEAATGVTVPVGVPVFYTCPRCAGSGHTWLFTCVKCNAEGTIEGEEMVTVRVPPMVHDRAIMEIPIHGLGIHNFYLCLHIRVAG
ncbi:MAG: DnaJ domain-containing protein [Alphaproteobacteria bacterium]